MIPWAKKRHHNQFSRGSCPRCEGSGDLHTRTNAVYHLNASGEAELEALMKPVKLIGQACVIVFCFWMFVVALYIVL